MVTSQQVQPPKPEAREQPKEEQPPPEVPPPDGPPAITIGQRAQSFTTTGPPSHVWFEVKNAGGPGSIEIVELAYLGNAGPETIKLDRIRLDDVEHSSSTMPVEPGTHVLDFGVSGQLPSGKRGYGFRLRAKVGGRDVTVESSVVFAHRDPIRR